jgi:hypothetical protein
MERPDMPVLFEVICSACSLKERHYRCPDLEGKTCNQCGIDLSWWGSIRTVDTKVFEREKTLQDNMGTARFYNGV